MTESGGRPATGVLLMAYGTPAGPDEIEAYYTHIRRGRPPDPCQLRELSGRYAAIGGTSPLLAICEAQAAGLQRALDAAAGPGAFSVRLAMKHADPFIERTAQGMIDDGLSRAVGLVLAPHRSVLSIDQYIERAKAAAGRIELCFIESWHLLDAYLDLLTARVNDAIAALPAGAADATEVIFTAHSLPERILAWDDPYPEQLRQTADAVAARAGLRSHSLAWQSAGRTRERWLGPDLATALCSLADAGREGVIVAPAGFTADHLEILYDLDIECRDLAIGLGLRFARTESLNADPALMDGLAGLVLSAADAQPTRTDGPQPTQTDAPPTHTHAQPTRTDGPQPTRTHTHPIQTDARP